MSQIKENDIFSWLNADPYNPYDNIWTILLKENARWTMYIGSDIEGYLVFAFGGTFTHISEALENKIGWGHPVPFDEIPERIKKGLTNLVF